MNFLKVQVNGGKGGKPEHPKQNPDSKLENWYDIMGQLDPSPSVKSGKAKAGKPGERHKLNHLDTPFSTTWHGVPNNVSMQFIQ